METTQNPALPPGVTTVPAPDAAAAPPAAAPATPAPVPVPPPVAPVEGKKWNWIEIGIGVAIVTGLFMCVYYWRNKTHQVSDDKKESDRKIKSLQADMNKVKQYLPQE